MRRLVKRLSGIVLIPLVRWYLTKTRQTRIAGLSINVSPGVFHPRLFGSTSFLLESIDQLQLENKTVLDLGCGSGVVAMFCARRKANVIAVDINPTAVANTIENASLNSLSLTVIVSDLFSALERQKFDFIFINPPYYAHDASQPQDLAWYCGKDFEYYRKLFSTLATYTNRTSVVWMVLTKGCDLDEISDIATTNQFKLRMVGDKSVLFEDKMILYQIENRS